MFVNKINKAAIEQLQLPAYSKVFFAAIAIEYIVNLDETLENSDEDYEMDKDELISLLRDQTKSIFLPKNILLVGAETTTGNVYVIITIDQEKIEDLNAG
jgi:hypothetical protein